MPVAVLGMHRCGTSLVAHLLHAAGVRLGPEADLFPANASNADGYWEHRDFHTVNEEILARLGGGWDAPPPMPAGWAANPELDALRTAAKAAIRSLDGPTPWGWKDPRTSLTLPFWQSLLPELKCIVCVRHPLEVALSLHQRGSCSLALGLKLWKRYIGQALRHAPPQRLVVHYGSLFTDAAAVLTRMFALLDLDAAALPQCLAVVKPELRHNRLGFEHLSAYGAPEDVISLYREACDEAGTSDASEEPMVLPPWAEVLLRNSVGQLGHAAIDRRARKKRIQLDALARDLKAMREDLADWNERVQILLADAPLGAEASPQRQAYRALSRRLREMILKCTPRGAIVSVIGKGDDALVQVPNRSGWHFPRDANGVYAGYYPASSLAAIAHLELQRADGAEFLAVPETANWWFEKYPEFRAHLESRCECLANEPGVGRLYSLHLRETASGKPLAEIIERARASLGRSPAILDWSGGTLAKIGDCSVFAPPSSNGHLPYVDRSVDFVLVHGDAPAMLAEATRVADLAVWNLQSSEITWQRELSAALAPSFSIIIPVCNQWPLTAACLKSLIETLPPDRGEIIIVDDASTDETPLRLKELAKAEPRLKAMRNESNRGFVETCNRGAAAATGEYLIFLNNDTVPLPGWLPPLLRTFAEFPRAGAVGGKLLHPDGRLQEAGGLIFADASAAHYGRYEADPSHANFSYLREIDYCSAALLATPRKLFADLGGFDLAYSPGYYEDTDYCFRLREAGYGVYYQPESVIIHREGGTAGTDDSRGMKAHQAINQRRFRERWRTVLAGQGSRPVQFDESTWQKLAVRS